MHGTEESPAIFADLICNARAAQRPLVAGVELQDQTAITRYLEAGPANEQAARRALLSAAEWRNGSDGRHSIAMLALLRQLREWKREGTVAKVVAFSPAAPDESAERVEHGMANALLAAANSVPDALVIALTGNVHASKKPTPGLAAYRLMASFFPVEATISLFVADLGGEAWTCQQDGCKPHAFSSTRGAARQLILRPELAPWPGYDGVLSTGLRASVSEPAAYALARQDQLVPHHPAVRFFGCSPPVEFVFHNSSVARQSLRS